ncbi:MAG: dockerin type I domain-containing protein [Candidatus Zixiibacteriota bacterium]
MKTCLGPFVFCLLAILLPITGVANTINVPSDMPLIQSAIDAASPGDTIRVSGREAPYYERLLVNKAIHLIGDGAAATVVNAGDSGSTLTISVNSVHIKNLSLVHSGDSIYFFSGLSYVDAGIQLISVDSCLVENCIISDNGQAGIGLSGADYNVIRNCQIQNNDRGFIFYDTAVMMGEDYNFGNTILCNRISANTNSALSLQHMLMSHRSNIISGNVIANNGYGLTAIVFDQNEVSYNSFNSNGGYAFYKNICSGGGSNNQIHYNGFFNNNGGDTQAYDELDEFGVRDNLNYNFWSDYTGIDGNSDGYGDQPYEIDCDMCSGYPYDGYPLMYAYDIDQDQIIDSADNCPFDSNADQADDDVDFIGDACDDCVDYDNDGYGNPDYPQNQCPVDNCPYTYNPNQLDSNQNGIGDACELVCGDVNFNGSVNILDVTYLVNYLYKSGPPPPYMQLADVNSSCSLNILDVTSLINYLYKGGAAPVCPSAWPCR